MRLDDFFEYLIPEGKTDTFKNLRDDPIAILEGKNGATKTDNNPRELTGPKVPVIRAVDSSDKTWAQHRDAAAIYKPGTHEVVVNKDKFMKLSGVWAAAALLHELGHYVWYKGRRVDEMYSVAAKRENGQEIRSEWEPSGVNGSSEGYALQRLFFPQTTYIAKMPDGSLRIGPMPDARPVK